MKKLLATILVVSFSLFQIVPPGFANPDLEAILHGDGRVEVNGHVYNIYQDSHKLIALFRSFNIAPNEITNVLQPSGDAAALFRILDQDPSRIFGTLNANGHLFLLNPNGILFGQNASVNVGSLVASSLDISNGDFLDGNYRFEANTPNPGLILNQGNINARDGGYVTFLGGAVGNEGSITANGGSINLGAGSKATMAIDGRGLMNIEVTDEVTEQATDLDGNPIADAVSNSGSLTANGGMVKLSGKAVDNAFDNIINHTGIIEANTVSNQNGVVVLGGGNHGIVSVTGTIDAKGDDANEVGGQIHVLGDKVYVDSTLDASGTAGGGEILVGGDFQGEGDVQTSSRTAVGRDAKLIADATENGDGGKVIVWSDENTNYYGHASVQGGSESGDGGLVEVSSKGNFGFGGTANLSAENGEGGTLLLDPLTLTLRGGNGPEPTGDIGFGDATNEVFEEQIEALSGTLGNGRLDLDAQQGVEVHATDSFGVNSTGNNGIELEGNASIRIRTRNNAGDGSGGVDLTSGTHGTDFELKTSGSGDITIIGRNHNNAGNPNTGDVRVGRLATEGGDVTLRSKNGEVQLTNEIRTDLGTNAGNVTIEGAAVIAGDVNIDTNGGGTDGNVSFIDDTTLGINTTSVNADSAANDRQLDIRAGSGDVQFDGAIGDTEALNDIHIHSANDVTVNGVTTRDGGIRIESSGTTTLNGNIDTTANAAGDAGQARFDGNVELGNNISINTDHATGNDANTRFSQTVNSASGTETLTVTAGDGNARFLGDVGTTNAVGSLSTTANNTELQTLVSEGNVQITGDANLSGDVTSNTGSVTVDGDTTLASSVVVTTGQAIGNDATFTGVVDGTAGTESLSVSAGNGNVDFQGDIGSTQAIQGLTVSSSEEASFQAITTGQGGVNITTSGNTAVLNGDVDTTAGTNAGDFTVNGAARLGSDVTINTDHATGNDGNTTFGGILNGTAGTENLNITAGSGDIDFQDEIGGTTALGSLTASGSNIDLQQTTANGDISLTGETTLNGDVTSNDMSVSVTGNTTLTNDITVTSGGGVGDDITFDGTINGTNPGQEDLDLNAGSGDVSVTDAIGGIVALGDLTITGENIETNGVSAATQTYNGNMTLNGVYNLTGPGESWTLTGDATLGSDTVIQTAGVTTNDDITFGGTINGTNVGGESLTLNAGIGDVSVGGAVGDTTELEFTSFTGSTVSVDAVTTAGSQTYNGELTVGGDLTSTANAAGGITVNGNTIITDDIQVSTNGAAGDDITFDGTIDADAPASSHTLTFNAGTNGDVTVNDAIGGNNAVEGFTLTTAEHATLNAITTKDGGVDITTTGNTTTLLGDINTTAGTNAGNVNLSGPHVLGNDITILTDHATGTDGSVTADDTINALIPGSQGLTITSGGADVDLQDAVGTTARLKSLEINANDIDLQQVQTTGDQTYNVNEATLHGDLSANGVGGSITVNGDALIDGDLNVTTAGATSNEDITFTGRVRADNNGTDADSLTVNAGSSDVDFQGNIGGGAAGNRRLEFVNATGETITLQQVRTANGQTYNGQTNLDGNLLSEVSGVIDVNGPAVLTDNVTVQTAGAAGDDIIFRDTINDASDSTHSLTLQAGAADIDLQGNVGGNTTKLASINASGDRITTQEVITGGDQTYTATTRIRLEGDLSSENPGGAILLDGNVRLRDDINISTAGVTANDDVTFTGTVQAQNGGVQGLNVNAGAGDVVFQDNVGGGAAGTRRLEDLNVTANTIEAQGTVRTAGDQTYNGDTTFGNSIETMDAGSITVNGSTTITNDINVETSGAAGDDITFNGNVDGAFGLSTDAGAGDTTFNFAVGSTQALTNFSATGANVEAQEVTTTASQSFNGETTLNGNLSAGDDIQVNGNTTLGDDITVQTGGGAGDNILFNGTVNATSNGAQGITTNSGANGNTTFGGNVGDTTDLAFVDVQNANDVNFNGTVNAGSLTQTNGSGTTTFNELATIDNNVDVTTGSIAFATNGSINSDSGNGDVSLTAQTGDITSTSTATHDVVAQNLATTADTGIALDTQVTNFEGQTNTSGGIAINNTGALNIGGVNGTLNGAQAAGAGDITITSTGAMNVEENVIHTGNSDINLRALGSGSTNTLTVEGTVASQGTGNNNLTAGGDLTLTSTAQVTTTTGTNTLTAGEDAGSGLLNDLQTSGTGDGFTAAQLNMVEGSQVRSNDGDANLLARGDVKLSRVNLNADSAGATGNATIFSENGSVLDNTIDEATPNLLADNATIDANLGVGSATGVGALDTEVNSLDVSVNGTGDTHINELDAVTLTDLDTANGDINVTAGGTIEVTDVNAAGDVSLTSTGGAINGTTNDGTADVIGETINLTAQVGGIGTDANGALDVTATTALNTNTSADNSDTNIDSIGDLPIGQVNAGTGNATINSTGDIDSVNNDGNADILANDINLTALDGGIGNDSQLEFTATGTFNADSSADGSDMNLESIGDVDVGLVTAGTAAPAGTAVGNREVTLASTGDIDSENSDAGTADIVGNTINLSAAEDGIGNDQQLEIFAQDEFNATTVTPNINTDGSDINVRSIGDLKVGTVTAGTGDAPGLSVTGTGNKRNVTLESTGAIDDSIAGEDNTADVIGNTVNLTAEVGGIGQTDELDVTARDEINATTDVADGGDGSGINMESIGDALIGEVTTGGAGQIDFDSTGAIDDSSAGEDNTADFNGSTVNLLAEVGGIGNTNEVDFTATTEINADTTADGSRIDMESIGDAPVGLITTGGAGDVDLDSTGAIDDSSAGEDNVADIVGDTINLLAQVGGIGQTNELDVTATTEINADTATTGDSSGINMESIGDALIGEVTTGGAGQIDFDSTGAIDDSSAGEDNTADFNGSTVNLLAEVGGIGNTNEVDFTATTEINADTTADGSRIDMESIGDAPVGLITTGGAGDVDLDSTGAIDDSSAGEDNVADIVGDTINLLAQVGGIGQTNELDVTATTEINADTATTGDSSGINMESIGDALIGEVTTGGAGQIDFDSTGAIDDSSAGEDNTADFNGSTVNLLAEVGGIGNTNEVDFTATTEINADTTADGSRIDMESIGDAPVGLITTGGAGDVDLDSTGAIDDSSAGEDNVADIVGDTINLLAQVGGIGQTNELDVTATTEINADTATTGDSSGINMESIGDALIGEVTTGGAGQIDFDSTGAIDDSSAGEDNTADFNGSTVNLLAEVGGIGNTNEVDFTATTEINADTTADGSRIDMESIGDAPVGLITTGGAGDVDLDSTGAIDDSSAGEDNVADIVGDTINLLAQVGGIGQTNELDVTATTEINADTATTGDSSGINMESIGDALIGEVTTGGAGQIDFDSTGAIDDSSAGEDNTADFNGSTVNLLAEVGGIGNTNEVDFTATTEINADTTADGSRIDMESIGDAPVGLITTGGAGDVDLDSTGAIDDSSAGEDNVADIVGDTINLLAQVGGIGNTNELDFTATTEFNADTTTDNSNVDLESIGNAPIGLIDAGTGEVDLNSTGAIDNSVPNPNDGAANIIGGTIDLVAEAGGIGTTNGPLEVTETDGLNADTTADSGNILIDEIGGDMNVGLIDANQSGGDIQLRAQAPGANIVDINDGATPALNVRGSHLDLIANNNIGVPNPLEIDGDSVTPVAGGSVGLSSSGSNPTLLTGTRVGGNFRMKNTGDLILEDNSVGGSAVLETTNSILTTDGIHTNDIDAFDLTLIAGDGTIGTPDDRLGVMITGAGHGGALRIHANGEQNGLSANIGGNVSGVDVEFINVPPGLVLYNTNVIGGGNIQKYTSSNSIQHLVSLESFETYGEFGNGCANWAVKDACTPALDVDVTILEPEIVVALDNSLIETT